MDEVDHIVSHASQDCFWLCDGTLKEYVSCPHRRKYFGSAAVNAMDFVGDACGGSIAPWNELAFTSQEAELMSIYCALRAAADRAREYLIIVTDDNSRNQEIHRQVVKTWGAEEMNWPVHRFRSPIISEIRMLIWDFLANKGVTGVIIINTDSLHKIRPGLVQKRKKYAYSDKDAEWEPHWKCVEMRDRCFRERIEANIFAQPTPDIWDYTAALPHQSDTVSGNLDMQPFWFLCGGHGFIIKLLDRTTGSMTTGSNYRMCD